MHNRILSFPGVVKNYALLNFEQASADVQYALADARQASAEPPSIA